MKKRETQTDETKTGEIDDKAQGYNGRITLKESMWEEKTEEETLALRIMWMQKFWDTKNIRRVKKDLL